MIYSNYTPKEKAIFPTSIFAENFSGGYESGTRSSVYVGEKTIRGLEWTAAPDLLKERYAHRSITIENKIYHIGGSFAK